MTQLFTFHSPEIPHSTVFGGEGGVTSLVRLQPTPKNQKYSWSFTMGLLSLPSPICYGLAGPGLAGPWFPLILLLRSLSENGNRGWHRRSGLWGIHWCVGGVGSSTFHCWAGRLRCWEFKKNNQIQPDFWWIIVILRDFWWVNLAWLGPNWDFMRVWVSTTEQLGFLCTIVINEVRE